MFDSIRAFGAAAILTVSAGQVAAASLSDIIVGPVALQGSVEYFFDLAGGFGGADGTVSGVPANGTTYIFSASGNVDFSPTASGGLPVPDFTFGAPVFDVFNQDLSDTTTDLSGDLVDFSMAGGMLTLLFEVVRADGDFAGFGPLAVLTFSDPRFPALEGEASLTIAPATLAETAVIPLPAAAPLMLAGLALLSVVARRRA